MKICPVCQQTYSQGVECPNCKVMLIDLDTNKAVRRNTKRGEKDEAAVKATEEEASQYINQSHVSDASAQQQTAQQEKGADLYGMPGFFHKNDSEQKTDTAGMPKKFNTNLPTPLWAGVCIAVAAIVVFAGIVPAAVQSNKAAAQAAAANAQTYEEEQYTGDPDITAEDDTEANAGTTDDAADTSSTDFSIGSLITYNNEHYSFKLPDYFNKYVDCRTDSEDSMAFYHSESAEATGDGWLFTVMRVPSAELSDYKGYETLAQKGDYSYIILLPSYVAYPLNDESTAEDYQHLHDDRSYIQDTFSVLDTDEEATIETIAGDYVLPESDSRYLEESDLNGLSPYELTIARNEIYARHGRRFKDEEIQSYFDSKDWYSGTVNPDDFQESSLNSYEKANASMILQYEKSHGYLQ